MFAQVELQIQPAPRGAGIRFVDATRGGAVPMQFVRAAESGVVQALAEGIGGIPIVDVIVTLVDGATHPQDSSEPAFKIAGRLATLDAMGKIDRAVLEPYVILEADVPAANAGAVVGDVARRRGKIMDLDTASETHVVRACIPLGETFGYAGSLGALTGGRGHFTMTAAGYERVPPHLVEGLPER